MFLIFVLWQTIKSQEELNEVNERLENQRRDFLLKNGARQIFLGNPRKVEKWNNRTGLNVKDGAFFIDEKPFQILGGSLHYFRFPSEYWYNR